jgi:hypothetical protein
MTSKPIVSSASGRSHPFDPHAGLNRNSSWHTGMLFYNSTAGTLWCCVDDKPGRGVWLRLVTEQVNGWNTVPAGEPMSLDGL